MAGTRRTVRAAAAFAGITLLVLFGIAVYRAIASSSRQLEVEPGAPVEIDADAAARRLARALQFETVSHQEPADFDASAFLDLHAFLEQSFPRTHAALEREVVGDFSLLYRWPGGDAGRQPILLMSHLDVVPVEPGTEDGWTHPPFGGEIEGGFVWGRGALDVKSGVLGILEAVEHLLAAGWTPSREVYLAFGHDEEVGGVHGNAVIARTLDQRGLHFEFVLDEGGLIGENLIDGVDRPVALIGVAEKGYVSVRLTARGEGGHSSMPPRQTPVGIVAAAVARLEHRPMPARFGDVMKLHFEFLGPELPFGRRLLTSNLWLFGPLLERAMLARARTAAMLRTTTAVTMIEGGVKENVIPQQATAVVNFRTLPGDSQDVVVDHVRQAIDDPRVTVEPIGSFTPGLDATSQVDTAAFRAIQTAVVQTVPRLVVVPYLLVGATDSRYYTPIADDVYRFYPARLGPDDLHRFHGTDERISVANHAEVIEFVVRLLRDVG